MSLCTVLRRSSCRGLTTGSSAEINVNGVTEQVSALRARRPLRRSRTEYVTGLGDRST